MSTIAVTIRRAALDAWQQLQAALQDTPVSCAGRTEWSSDDPEERIWAARQCLRCPALEACRQFAISNLEPAHIWGGLDMADRTAVRQANNHKELSA